MVRRVLEDGGLTVVRVPQGQLLPGFLVGEDTHLVVDRVEVTIVCVERGSPIALAQGWGASGLGRCASGLARGCGGAGRRSQPCFHGIVANLAPEDA